MGAGKDFKVGVSAFLGPGCPAYKKHGAVNGGGYQGEGQDHSKNGKSRRNRRRASPLIPLPQDNGGFIQGFHSVGLRHRISPNTIRILCGQMNVLIKKDEGEAKQRQTQTKSMQSFPSQVRTDPVLVS
jgi:hypothetical protein